MSSEYKEGVWYGWNGGECPVHPRTIVEISTRMGAQEAATASAWTWHMSANPIIAFRVIKQHREPLDVWLRQGILSGEWHPCRPAAEGAILFREVLE